jgi:hypothetical protein
MGSCGSAGPGVAGAVGTEEGSAVENVDVSLSGQANASMQQQQQVNMLYKSGRRL